MLNASDAFQMDGGKLFKEDEDLGDIFFDTVSFVEIVKPRKPEKPGGGASFWKRDPVGIRTQDPQLRRLLLYPAELQDHPAYFA